jgi:GNAT superfamily N-acetyltransferase
MNASPIVVRALTPSRWKDFEELFGPRGACAGCWCQWIRMPSKEFRAKRGAASKRIMRRLVSSGNAPGLLAYEGRRAVGWVAVAPRAQYRRLEKSRVLKPVDQAPVWSVPCFFVAADARRRGVTPALLEAAAKHAASRGAKALEGYPVDTGGKTVPAAFVWWGMHSTFRKSGFREIARRSKTRPIMRRELC